MTAKLKVLVYWHDMGLDYSRYLLEAFDNSSEIGEVLALAPERRTAAAAIYQVASKEQKPLQKTRLVPVKTLKSMEIVCTPAEWRRHISEFKPDITIVLDEALSPNVLAAGMVSSALGNGRVFFYGFENIVQDAGIRAFLRAPSGTSLKAMLRRTFRWWVLDRMAMPWRRKWVRGGLYSYEECADIVRAMKWNPLMKHQWWGINEHVFSADGPKADIKRSTTYLAGFAGRFIPEKGILDLVDAFAHLGPDYGLALIGDGPQKGEIQSRIAALNLADRIQFIPPQNAVGLAAHYRALDLVVLPSRTIRTWKEQYGRVLMEAMRCGTPVVGSDSGAIPCVIADPACVFPEGDAVAMAAAIKHACQNRPSPASLAARVANTESASFVRAWLDLAADVDKTA